MSVEDKQKAITEIEGQVKEIEERKCETPEEVEARNAELSEAASKFEGAIAELKEVRRLESLRAQADEVRTELSPAGTVAPAPKKEVRALSRFDVRPGRQWPDAETADRVGEFLVRMSRGEVSSRAVSPHPIGSTDTIAADSMGETSPTYDGKGSELVMHELYRGILEQLYYSSICLDLASVYNVNTSGLHIPIAGDAPLAEFYDENTEIKPFNPATSKAILELKKMGQRVQASNELLDDAYINVSNMVTNQIGSSFALTADTSYFQGNAAVGIEGLCDAIEGYNAGSNVLEVADPDAPTTGELAFPWKTVHQHARNRKWVVSPQGWAGVMAIATAPEAGAVVTDSVRATIYGAPVYVCTTLPDDVLAIYGDFEMSTAVGIKSNGVTLRGSAERAMELDAYVWVGTNRMAFAPHSPEFLAMLKAPSTP
jgi:HK97 family phage major capsid protein